MWIEDYIEKLYSDGMVKEARMMGASQEMVMSNWDEQAVASGAKCLLTWTWLLQN
jgi:hypothetical protein